MRAKGFEDLREKPIRANDLMRVKAVQSTTDLLFSNEGSTMQGCARD